MNSIKNKNLAAILAFFGGVVGLHRFYLGQNGRGFMMVFFALISLGILSSLIGIIDSIRLLIMSDKEFDFKYNNPDTSIRPRHRYRSYERKFMVHSSAGNSNPSHRRDRRIDIQEFRDRMGNRDRTKTSHGNRPVRRGNSKQDKRAIIKLINEHKERGLEKFKEYDIEGSVQEFKQILKIDPHHIAANFNLACAYSQLELPQKSMRHISTAVKAGFDDLDRIRKHDKLAFVRIQPEWEDFAKNGFIFDMNEESATDNEAIRSGAGDIEDRENAFPEETRSETGQKELLEHLNKLKDQRERGIISEDEFDIERRKLMSS